MKMLIWRELRPFNLGIYLIWMINHKKASSVQRRNDIKKKLYQFDFEYFENSKLVSG